MAGDELVSDGLLVSIQDQLKKFNVSTELWGSNGKKGVDDLANEVASGDCKLIESESGLLRTVSIVAIDLYHTNEDGTFRLREDRQVFKKDGSERRRDLGGAIQEKMKSGEDLKETAQRAIIEELGEEVDPKNVSLGESRREVTEAMESPSYPGLMSNYDKTTFDATIAEGSFNPNGYEEDDGKKITYFVWEKIT